MLGGGMRQAGILAAAGIVALEKMTGRLVQDHIRAKKLAVGLRQVPGLVLELGIPATNMVFLSLTLGVKYTNDEVIERLKECGIRIGASGERQFRLVTHYWVDDAGVEKTIAAFRSVLG
jgi:threonine aldolase